MNFSTHIQNIRERLKNCLSLSKVDMLMELKECLLLSKALLKTNQFDFDINQFNNLEIVDFATTDYGLKLAQGIMNRNQIDSKYTRFNLASELSWVCENVMTYTVDDCCSMQSEYHWFYCEEGDFVYKESEMGVVVMPDGKQITGVSRVAKISDLPADFHENLI